MNIVQNIREIAMSLAVPWSNTPRITLNLALLVADGRLRVDEAEMLLGLAEQSRLRRIFVNLLLIFGSLMVVGGVLALKPTLTTGLLLALTSLGAGTTLFARGKREWGLLGRALIHMGLLGLSGWIGMQFHTMPEPWPHLMWPVIATLFVVGAIAYRDALLAALAAIAIGYVLGGSTRYWHASYALVVEEPILSIATFTLLGAVVFWFRNRLPQAYQLAATVFWRTSFILANFAFWVGSLWGDYVLDGWLSPGYTSYSADTWADAWKAYEAWRDQALFIHETVFVIAWPVVLLAMVAVGARTRQLFLVNTSLVFLGIHFYTQFHEVMVWSPVGLVIGGLLTITLGLLLVRANLDCLKRLWTRWRRS